MSHKRQQSEEGTSFDDKRPRTAPSFRRVVEDVMVRCRMQHYMEPILEPLIRRVVKEEVDSALRKYIFSMKRNGGKDSHPYESKSLQLQFLNGISLPVFTGTRIEGEGGASMEVALVDTYTREVVSNGVESSAKVEIVVLEGDFDGNERDNWTIEDFRNNIVKQREGKKPLLSGDVILSLKDGTGLVGNIMFTDNSSWTRSRKFRLGARILDNVGDVRVREAKSEPLVVRDHRGELYKKHHPPSLSDEVWRLEKIGKGGAFHRRLKKERINTVQDFLMLLFLDPTRLRTILGNGMPAKMWEITVEHARTCVLDKKLYLYDASQKNAVVFNVVGQVMGIVSNGHYLLTDKLSEEEKAEARESVISAFADREKIVSLDEESSLNMPTSSNLPSEDNYQENLNSLKNVNSNYLQENPSTPDYMQSVHSVEGFDDCYQPLTFPSQVTADSLISGKEHLQYFEGSHLELSADIQSAINAYMPGSSVTIDKTHRGWNVLFSVLRWWFSIKRIVARKTGVR